MIGSCTARDFNLGCYERTEIDDYTRATIDKEHGVYHVRGFLCGVHFWESFHTIREARAYARKQIAGAS